MKARFYAVTGLNARRRAGTWTGTRSWRRSRPASPCASNCPTTCPARPSTRSIVDEPVANVIELRQCAGARLPEAAERLGDRNLNVAVNGEMVLSGEQGRLVASGDKVSLFSMIAGG